MSLYRRFARSLRLGKEKFYVGADLEGNSFYERPSEEYADEWRKAKRTVEYKVARPLSEYRFYSVPVQWNAWMRRTRREPPTIPELEADALRQRRLAANVDRLAVEYREEKLRIAERAESDRMEGLQVESGRSGPLEVEQGEQHEETVEEQKATLRQRFADENAFKGAKNPDSDFQPEEWTPAPRRR